MDTFPPLAIVSDKKMEESEEGEDDDDEEVLDLCLWHLFGHCKFGSRCQQKHVIEVCKIEVCEGGCRQRHPPICKYWSHYGRCKFGDRCSFKHQSSYSTESVI